MIKTLQKRSRFDLHMHTSHSDGKFGPEEVLRKAAKGGLDVIAITDHDLVGATTPGMHEIDGHPLYVIAAAEISGRHEGAEYHLLVYFPGEIPEGFRTFCEDQCRERATRYATAIERMGLEGIAEPESEALEGRRALTRLHLARELVATGHAKHVGDAFGRFLGDRNDNVPKLSLPITKAIEVARAFGGITSWAHPRVASVKHHLSAFLDAGLQGIEGLRPMLTSRDRGFLRRTARRHGLFLTGGSDWHGWIDEDLGLFSLTGTEVGDFMDSLAAA